MFKKILLLHLFLLVICYSVSAQVSGMSQSELSQMKVDNLSDDQIRQLVSEMKRNNVSYSQIDQYASQKGIPDTEVSKLKSRISQLNLDRELTGTSGSSVARDTSGRRSYIDEESSQDTTDYYQERYKKIRSQEEFEKELKRQKVFGTELFSNKNLTFEPNLRMATPPTYRLGAEDELIIDVYGYSEVQHRLKISPEGYVRIPNLGLVYVNGLTMAEAQERITRQLSTIYSGIRSGNTFVQVSLGNIRSIRVLLIGEIMRPGTYTLPSLATVANALYVSGGPNENGSFRSIQVIRNGQPVANFDLYDFLIHGDLSNNIVLQDQDIVKVNAYKMRVELIGEIKRPAIYEAKDNETLQQVVDFAGGYTDNSYKDVIRVLRINSKAREVVSVSAADVGSFKLRSGDKFYIDSVLNRYTNRVRISGAVSHPGDYSLEEGMTVGDLIVKADGVQEEAVMSRGIIRRLNDDYTPSLINFNVKEVLSGSQKILLKREDSVIVFSKLKIREDYMVKIDGEVNAPGFYVYGDSMHLEDLILLAGGLKDAASLKHVEISRRLRTGTDYDSTDTRMAITEQFDINSDLSGNPGGAMSLKPFDEVMIRKAPEYTEQANVFIDGEVVYPGFYTINTRQEKISDVIKRAGGLKQDAYAEGAVMLRKTFINSSDSVMLLNKLEVFYNKLKDTTDIERMRGTFSRKEQLLGINLDKILSDPGSKYDLYLEKGDAIRIPKRLQTVQMFGEVYFPKKVRFDKKFGFRDYVRGAGGFTAQALRKRSYIVYSNGEVKSTRHIIFLNSYPKVKPGAEIYVPVKKARSGLNAGEAVGIASALASMALVIVTIINSTK